MKLTCKPQVAKLQSGFVELDFGMSIGYRYLQPYYPVEFSRNMVQTSSMDVVLGHKKLTDMLQDLSLLVTAWTALGTICGDRSITYIATHRRKVGELTPPKQHRLLRVSVSAERISSKGTANNATLKFAASSKFLHAEPNVWSR